MQKVSLDRHYDMKKRLLTELGERLATNCRENPEFYGSKPVLFAGGMLRIAGPRSGILKVPAGVDGARLYTLLTKNDYALLRPLLPAGWDFGRAPQVYWSGRYLCVEAQWPEALQFKDVRLDTLGQVATQNTKRFIVGLSQYGETITAQFSSSLPNLLVSGMTGSGKSSTMRSIAIQLARNQEQAELLFIDGKQGEGLGPVCSLPGTLGPLVVDTPDAVRALGYAYTEMIQRNATYAAQQQYVVEDAEIPFPELYVFIDEFDPFMGDPAFARLMYLIAKQGRSANVRVIAGIQKPSQAHFGDEDATRSQFDALAHRVRRYKDSEVAVGGPFPRADWLGDAGDAHLVTGRLIEHVQVALPPRSWIRSLTGAQAKMQAWPSFDASAISDQIDTRGRPVEAFDASELTVGLWSALQGHGRDKTIDLLRRALGYGMGKDRTQRLLKIAESMRTVWNRLEGAMIPTWADAVEGQDDAE